MTGHRQMSGLRVALTLGDPYGVGPEIVARGLSNCAVRADAGFIIVGSARVAAEACRRFGGPQDLRVVQGSPADVAPGECVIVDVGDFGVGELPPACDARPRAEGGQMALAAIERAVALVKAHRADAIVTAPISKEAIHLAGSAYPGHTELLADLCGGGRPVMFFVAREMRVALVTIHRSLRSVPDSVSKEAVEHTARTLHGALRRFFGLKRPRIAVCGLNPHAGEHGLFGDEEGRVIAPALALLREDGISIDGPLPADTIFGRHVRGEFDAVVAMYHDQGLIPIKLYGMEFGVNVTLGLPLIRTSPDHGTAYDIAWQGKASPSSLIEAIRIAVAMAGRAGYGAGRAEGDRDLE